MEQQPENEKVWFGGKHNGTIKELKYQYTVSITNPKISKVFLYKNYKNKQKAYKAAKAWREQISVQNNLAKNRICRIDDKTIEVQAGEYTFLTDYENLDIVEKYTLSIKLKSEKNKPDRKYVNYQVKQQQTALFTSLFCNYNIVKYIDGNTLNVCKSNLMEFGAVVMNAQVIKDKYIDPTADQYKYFSMHYSDLPKNMWILGKPRGTIFKIAGENAYTARVVERNGKSHSCTFDPAKYKKSKNPDEDAHNAAKKWKCETSYKLGATKNMIKILNDEYMVVKLSKNKTMVTDIMFIDVVQQISLFVTKSSNINAKYYASYSYKNDNDIKKNYMFHRLLTGFTLTDHLNRDPLDNRLINLRFSTYSDNNKNKEFMNEFYCIKKKYDDAGKKVKSYSFKTKIEKKDFEKTFSTAVHGTKIALEKAIAFRNSFYSSNVNSDEIDLTGITKPANMEYLIDYNLQKHDELKKKLPKNANDYIDPFFNNAEKEQYDKFMMIQQWRLQNYKNKIQTIRNKMNDVEGFSDENIKIKKNEIDICTDFICDKYIKTNEYLKELNLEAIKNNTKLENDGDSDTEIDSNLDTESNASIKTDSDDENTNLKSKAIKKPLPKNKSDTSSDEVIYSKLIKKIKPKSEPIVKQVLKNKPDTNSDTDTDSDEDTNSNKKPVSKPIKKAIPVKQVPKKKLVVVTDSNTDSD